MTSNRSDRQLPLYQISLTRRALLQATMTASGALSLAACGDSGDNQDDDNEVEPTQAISKSFGDRSLPLVTRVGQQRQEYVKSRVKVFSGTTPEFPDWKAYSDTAIEVGGAYTNELAILTPTDINATTPEWAEVLTGGLSSTLSPSRSPEALDAFFVSTRQFIPSLSRKVGAPVVGYSEGLLLLRRNASGTQLGITTAGTKVHEELVVNKPDNAPADTRRLPDPSGLSGHTLVT